MPKYQKSDYLPWLWLALFVLLFVLFGCATTERIEPPATFKEEDKYWSYF